MPRGQVLNIPNGQAVTTVTLSHEEKASLAMLNPNDGVLYVKINGPASNTPTMWDWKVPSQSYCQLPGPWQSLGVFYQDQSGGGAAAQVNVYESDSDISIPSFLAIGRAIQTAGTTMDISTGSQPSNPPANTVRLWADGSGNIHVLNATGGDKTLIDSLTPLGGDLYGTYSLAHIGVQQGQAISAYDSGGTLRRLINVDGANDTIHSPASTNPQYWQNFGNTANIMWLDNGGTLTLANGLQVNGGPLHVAGAVNFDSTLTVNSSSYLHDVYASRGDGTGVYYFANSGSLYLYYDGSNFRLQGGGELSLAGKNLVGVAGITCSAAVSASAFAAQTAGYCFYLLSAANSLYWDNSSLWQVASVGPTFQFTQWGVRSCSFAINANGVQWAQGQIAPWFCPNDEQSPGDNGFMGPRRSGAPANELTAGAHLYVPGSVWCTNVQNVSQRELKTNLDTLNPGEAIKLVADGRVKSYRYEWQEPIEGSNPADSFSFGFLADEMVLVCPEVVEMSTIDGAQIPAAINYNQLVSVLWSAVRNLNDRISTVELAA